MARTPRAPRVPRAPRGPRAPTDGETPTAGTATVPGTAPTAGTAPKAGSGTAAMGSVASGSNFRNSIPLVLAHEGGFVNHPNDPGGATNKGITIATFKRYIKPSGTVKDLKNMTTEQATIVYKRHYWDPVCGDMLPAGVDHAVFDFAVNSGPSRAAKYLQKVVGVNQDGKIGPATLKAVHAMPAAAVVNTLMDERLAFMKRIRGGKSWKTFSRGWQKRIDRVRGEASAMLA